MFLIRQELLHLVFFSLMSLIQLLSQEVVHMEMQEELEIELLISFSLKWTVLERRRIYSLLEQRIDLKFSIKLCLDL